MKPDIVLNRKCGGDITLIITQKRGKYLPIRLTYSSMNKIFCYIRQLHVTDFQQRFSKNFLKLPFCNISSELIKIK